MRVQSRAQPLLIMPPTPPSRSLTTLSLCSLSLLGAFLLFQVQPVMSKFILPWFGGSPGVWTTCMLFFQVVLFLGYAYAHALIHLPRKWQGTTHGLLALAALACLPISPTDAWKPKGTEDPTMAILLLLAATVGLPYFVLSSTSPLVQVWFSRAIPGGRPWRLYALSNIGSLAALLSYPFFFEPRWDVVQQTGMWSVTFVIFVVLSLYGAWQDRRSIATTTDETESAAADEPDPGVPWWHRVLWVFLPAMASIMLLATTNEVCQNVAVIPFMWVAPLSLYLITFIICFEHERWYKPALWAVPAMALLFLASGWDDLSDAWNTLLSRHDAPSFLKTNFVSELAAFFLAMFVACMVCHGELTRLKPPHRHLTEFYLMMSAGGALGGLTVSLVAPKVFTTYTEWPLGLMACFVITAIIIARQLWRAERQWLRAVLSISLLALLVYAFVSKATSTSDSPDGIFSRAVSGWTTFLTLSWKQLPAHVEAGFGGLLVVAAAIIVLAWVRGRHWLQAAAASALVLTVVTGLLRMEIWGFTVEPRIDRVRNFYGAISVSEEYDPGLEVKFRKLSHGTITHGIQNLGQWQDIPITYYGHQTGVGMALDSIKNNPTARVGVVGMGAGTVACYGKAGQVYRFYDINPDIVRLAKKDFTYLSDMEKRGARLEIIIGDARLSLERELPQHFDVILLDAFSGDSVPVHLLTKEAFDIYKHHLKPDGIIAVHVTNTYLRLAPVVKKLASAIGMKTTRVETDAEGDDYSTDYVLVTNNSAFLAAHPEEPSTDEAQLDVPVWTDTNHNLFRILNRR